VSSPSDGKRLRSSGFKEHPVAAGEAAKALLIKGLFVPSHDNRRIIRVNVKTRRKKEPFCLQADETGVAVSAISTG
jgi:hypothetical protein